MLRNFLYLNEKALGGYVSALEDGLRGERALRSKTTSTVDGKASVAGFGAAGARGSDVEASDSYSDTSEARFERFLYLSQAEPEKSGWVDVTNPDDDFPSVYTGAFVEFDCEIHVPPMLRALSRNGGIVEMLGLYSSLAPHVVKGQQDATMPSPEQIQAVQSVASMAGDDLVILGERDDTDWRVSGKLSAIGIRDDELDGSARVVGKVASILGAGEHKSLMALPGMNLMSREQRRQQAKTGPKGGDEASWLTGPALVLDILAVYR
jgi:hypothetical protein